MCGDNWKWLIFKEKHNVGQSEWFMYAQGAMTFYEISKINMEAFKIQNEDGKTKHIYYVFLRIKRQSTINLIISYNLN